MELTEVKYAGRLSYFFNQWSNITDNPMVLGWVTGIKIRFSGKPNQGNIPNVSNTVEEIENCEKVIKKLTKIGAISACSRDVEGQFLSPYFLRQKPDKEFRFILNLKSLNEFITPPHFKLEDCRTVIRLIHRNAYMTNIDLKDAYFILPIATSYRRYLRFKFKNTIFEFNCLPFGLNVAPYIFTKILKPILKKIREEGIISVAYLDDILIISSSIKNCERDTLIVTNLLQSLGFIINYEKSQLFPKRQCKFLGFIFNTEDCSISLTTEKRRKICENIKCILSKNSHSIRDIAKIIGNLVAACPAIPYGWLYTKQLEREKCLQLKIHGNFDRTMSLSEEAKNDIKWWIQILPLAKNSIRTNNYRLEIFSDASRSGWGAYCNGVRAHGFWEQKEREKHINFLELSAAFNGLKSFTKNISNCEILLRIDNTTAISYVNKMGGVRHKNLHSLTKSIWQYCEKKQIHIFASYINTKLNAIADAESRISSIETEYELSNSYFEEICRTFHNPHIDLFATKLNTKCELFVSWKPDPSSLTVDSFTISWQYIKFYAFPPFSLITRVLQKIIADEAEGIVVVPLWGAPSALEGPYPGCRNFIREALIRRNFPMTATHGIIASVTPNTLKQYDVWFKKWWEYCIQSGQNPFSYSLENIINFLDLQFRNCKSFSSINICKSALRFFMPMKTEDEPIIKRYLKGIYNNNPPTPKYEDTWDPQTVLCQLELWHPIENLTLEILTYKMVTLLALITAHRVQTLTKIKITNIHVQGTDMNIRIDDRIKTSGPNKPQPILNIPFFREKPELCLASLILHYIEITKLIRPRNENQLIIIRNRSTPPQHSRKKQKNRTCIGITILLAIIVAITILIVISTKKKKVAVVGAIVTSGHGCADIGVSILKRGGNAVDAAIAALFCEGVAMPECMGLGGGFLLTLYNKTTGEVWSLNAREAAPGAATEDMFVGQPANASWRGGKAAAVPGELRGYWHLYNRFGGGLSWSELVQPTIDLCNNGIYVTKTLAHRFLIRKELLYTDPVLRDIFFDPDTNDTYKEGQYFKRPRLARTLEVIAHEGGDALHNGSLTERFIKDINEKGGIMTSEDMQNYQPKWQRPAEAKLIKNHTLYASPLPGSGVILAFILNILSNFLDLKDPTSVTTNQRIVESFKFGYGRRTEFGDPDYTNFAKVLENLTSSDYIASIRSRIFDNQTFQDPFYYGAKNDLTEDHGTSHISVLSPAGDAVSVTSTINFIFGAGFASNSTGIILNDDMDDFSSPNMINGFGLPASRVNYIAPGKRPMSSMCPAIILDGNGNVIMVPGASGGTKITTANAITIIKHLWFGMDLNSSINEMRLHHQLFPMKIIFENDYKTKGKYIVDGLAKIGHDYDFKDEYGFAAVAAISSWPFNEGIVGVCDDRRAGSVAYVEQ